MIAKDLRVALVGPLPPPSGGMANQTRQLAALLEREGVQVEVVQVNPPYSPRWIESVRGVRALCRLVPYIVRLWRAAGRGHLFHVMANSGWAWHFFAAPAIWIGKLRGIPVLVNYRGGYAEEFFEKSFFWVRPTMRLADRVIVPSGFLKEVFAKFGQATEVVPNIIDLARFVPNLNKKTLCTDAPHLIVTRNLESIYDIETALRAFAFIKANRPEARMTIAGSGPERDKLIALSHALDIKENVLFTGRLDNERMAGVYQQADVFLNPSRVDNMPISILEALASGVPVVTTDVGGIPFLVEQDRTAIMVPPADARAMATAVLDLLHDREKAQRMAAAGRDYVQRYRWESVRSRLFDVYGSLATSAAKTRVDATK